jgi:hypothetical protein
MQPLAPKGDNPGMIRPRRQVEGVRSGQAARPEQPRGFEHEGGLAQGLGAGVGDGVVGARPNIQTAPRPAPGALFDGAQDLRPSPGLTADHEMGGVVEKAGFVGDWPVIEGVRQCEHQTGAR